MAPIITLALHEVLKTHPGKTHVHFTADGHYHFRVFSASDRTDKNLYTRLKEVPEKSKQGIATGKHINAPILNLEKKPDERYLVEKTMTREEVLAIAPVDSNILLSAGPSRAEILASLAVTDEEFEAIRKAIVAKGKGK